MKKLSIFLLALSILGGAAPAQGMSFLDEFAGVGRVMGSGALGLAAGRILVHSLPSSMQTTRMHMGISAVCAGIIALELRLGLRRALFASQRQSLIDDVVHSTADGDSFHRMLLINLFGVNTADSDGYTALARSAAYGRIDLVQMLLAANAHPDAVGHGGPTPLALASLEGNNDIVDRLLTANANPDFVGRGGSTPLMIACSIGYRGNRGIVERLLTANANPNYRNDFGLTALMLAANLNDHHAVEILLRDDRTKVNITNRYMSALMYAISAGSPQIIRALLTRGGSAGVDSEFGDAREFRNERGYNALHRTTLNEGRLPEASLTESVRALLYPEAPEERADGVGAGAGAPTRAQDYASASDDDESAFDDRSEDGRSESEDEHPQPEHVDLGFDVNARVLCFRR